MQLPPFHILDEVSVGDPACLADYAKREPTHREHAGEIQRVYGYRDFSDASAQAELRRWLAARAWATAERPCVLFDLATARLIEAKVLLPGATVLARAVASARDRAAARLYRTLAEAVIGEQSRTPMAATRPHPASLAATAPRRSYPRQEPSALAAHAGICAGAARTQPDEGGPYRNRG